MSSFECPHCALSYKRKLYYKRHILLCEILSKTKKEREQEIEEHADTPSLRKMYDLLLEMTFKYSKMEKKLEDLTKWVEAKKKKINIVEWLNENYTEGTNFAHWYKSIKFNRSHLELIFKYNFINGFMYIFQELLPLEQETGLPIKAFDQKDNTLFIYNDDEKWDVMSQKQLEQFISYISRLIMGEFVKWQTENANTMDAEKFSDIYTENIQKVIGANYSMEQLNIKMKRELYKYLKMNLKNVIEYEFSF